MQAGKLIIRPAPRRALGMAGATALRVAAIAALALWAAGAAQAANPIDPVSNPGKLDYPDVQMELPDYDEPFQRDGVMSQPQRFRQIVPGLPAAEVVRLIGRPLEGASAGATWDYNFTFRLPRSENYIVCQYKVVFDTRQQVKEAAWRRHQCLDIVNGAG